MSNKKWWHNLEQGQALMEYWPTIPAAIMIIISTGILGSFLRSSFGQTAEVLNRSSAGIDYEQCEVTEDSETGTDAVVVGNQLIEFVGKNYDGTNTTIVYRVTEEKQKGNNGVGNGEDGQPPGNPPINDGEGTSPGNPGNKGGADKTVDTDVDTAVIINLGLSQDVANNIIDSSQIYVYADGVVFTDSDTKGNNGVGNGEDGQPPGNPPINDGEGTSPGNPGNKGGANNTDDTGITDIIDDVADEIKGNNGVGNGEDGQPPGEPPINDGEGTSPGNPGNKGGAKNGKRTPLSSHMTNIGLFQTTTSSVTGFNGGKSYEITLILSGEYDFAAVTVTTTTNGNTSSGSISGPVTVIDQGHTQTTINECDTE